MARFGFREEERVTLSHMDLYGPALATGSEKALLHARLKLSRDALVWKLEGLDDDDVRRPMTETATNLIGLVKHLTRLEAQYLCHAFDRPTPTFAWESEEDAKLGHPSDMYARPEERVEDLIADYHAACAAADRTIEELDLDTKGRHPFAGVTVSLRWMLLNVLLDTARHAGHADIIREQIDGSAGGGRGRELPKDNEFWSTYHARVSGEIDTETWMAFLRARS
jgi:hypothetical protein